MSASPPLHFLLFASPVQPCGEQAVELAGKQWPGVVLPSPHLPQPWLQSWEETFEKLEQLPRLYSEPDGSFTWSYEGEQLAGVLYDREGKMCYAELFSQCTRRLLTPFLTACGAPQQRFVFQLAQAGIVLDEATFLAFLDESAPSG